MVQPKLPSLTERMSSKVLKDSQQHSMRSPNKISLAHFDHPEQLETQSYSWMICTPQLIDAAVKQIYHHCKMSMTWMKPD